MTALSPLTVHARRSGDFYEFYESEAHNVATVLGLVTTRNRNGSLQCDVPAKLEAAGLVVQLNGGAK